MEIVTKSAQETKELGQRVGSSLNGGDVLGLVGDLGAGKTTFVQGLAEGLGIKERLISPTFILVREYNNKFDGKFYHIDLYRLEVVTETELEALGIMDFVKNNKNVVLIEWADKAKGILPKDTFWINFENLGGDQRKLLF